MKATAPKLVSFSASDLAGKMTPERLWAVRNYVPHRDVTLLGGDGGIGKTSLVLSLVSAMATSTNWLGLETRPGRSLFVSAEDDRDELHRRLAAIRFHLSVEWSKLADVHLLPLAGYDAVMGAFDGRKQIVAPTPLFHELESMARDKMVNLVVLDTLSDIFAGNENDRQQVRQFIGMWRGLALRLDAAVLLLAHPSLAGMASGSGLSGSTAWSNSVRSRLYLSSRDRDDIRTLQVMKANYGPSKLSVDVRWQNGVYALIDKDETVNRSPEAADECFLMLLDTYTAQERHVSPSPSASYAPSIFANDRIGAAFSKEDFRDAMNRLMHAGKIKAETIGPPSRRTKRIIRALTK